MTWLTDALRDTNSQDVPMGLIVEAENTQEDPRTLALKLALKEQNEPLLPRVVETLEQISGLSCHTDDIEKNIDDLSYEIEDGVSDIQSIATTIRDEMDAIYDEKETVEMSDLIRWSKTLNEIIELAGRIDSLSDNAKYEINCSLSNVTGEFHSLADDLLDDIKDKLKTA